MKNEERGRCPNCGFFMWLNPNAPGLCNCGIKAGTNVVSLTGQWICAHKTATEMITEAVNYLDKIAGSKFIDDPGYFQ